ncbi:unnamed protein product [Musa textilis]
MHCQKYNIRNMFTSEKWVTSKWIKEAKGKRATDIILMSSFSNLIVYILKIIDPLFQVLWLVDNEKKPTMRYIYKASDRAKEAIQKSFDGNEEKYNNIFTIIDERWDCQLYCSLHATEYYLNLEVFYKNSFIKFDAEVINGLYKCITRLVPNLKV